MADLTDLQAAETVKIAGADPSTGVESNFMKVDSHGSAQAAMYDVNGVGITSTHYDSKEAIDIVNSPIDGYKSTYSCAILGLTAATSPTDVLTIQGSATKTIRVLKITIDAVQNTSGNRDIVLIKRSTANSGGTSSSNTIVPHDSNSAAATAVVTTYTANPSSLGTAVGNVRTSKIQQLATNVTNPLDHIAWDFGNRPGQALVLRGTSEFLAINLNAVTSSNNSYDINIEFTEE